MQWNVLETYMFPLSHNFIQMISRIFLMAIPVVKI